MDKFHLTLTQLLIINLTVLKQTGGSPLCLEQYMYNICFIIIVLVHNSQKIIRDSRLFHNDNILFYMIIKFHICIV